MSHESCLMNVVSVVSIRVFLSLSLSLFTVCFKHSSLNTDKNKANTL